MPNQAENNKRIAKNTLMLYIRMLITMVLGLFTSRVVLQSLGVEDYGIYNIVGGFVSLFSLLSGSLSAAISRFLTFELGKGNIENLRKVFSSAVTIQIGLSLIIVILAETVGLWFLNSKLVIPEERMFAAHCVYQLSILTFVIGLISVPYNAAIIAHERMYAFAYMSILDVTGKLLIAYSLYYATTDRLILFAILGAILSLLNRLIYGIYCKKNFEECTYRFFFEPTLLKQMFGFAGWNFFGAGSYLLMNQGVNLLLNMYFGVVVNAARGIAVQVDSAVTAFVGNFTTALNPQITKSYASDNRDYMYNLMFRGAKFSFFLLLIFAVPIICETDFILYIWLKTPPLYAINFVRLAIVVSMIHVLSNTMITAMLATGNIKKYQIIVGGLGMLVLPIVWGAFMIGLPPEMAYITVIIIFILQLLCRLFLLRSMIDMPIGRYIKEVLCRVAVVALTSFTISFAVCNIMSQSFIRLFIVALTSFVVTTSLILLVGLDDNERSVILKTIKQRISIILKRNGNN